MTNTEHFIIHLLQKGLYASAIDAFTSISVQLDLITRNRLSYIFLKAMKKGFILSPFIRNRILNALAHIPSLTSHLRSFIRNTRNDSGALSGNFFAAPAVNEAGEGMLVLVSVVGKAKTERCLIMPDHLETVERNVTEATCRVLLQKGFMPSVPDLRDFRRYRFHFTFPVIENLAPPLVRLTDISSLELAMALALAAFLMHYRSVQVIATGHLEENRVTSIRNIPSKLELIRRECPGIPFFIPSASSIRTEENVFPIRALSEALLHINQSGSPHSNKLTDFEFFSRVQFMCRNENDIEFSDMMYQTIMDAKGEPAPGRPSFYHYLTGMVHRFHLLKKHFRFESCLSAADCLMKYEFFFERYEDMKMTFRLFACAYSTILTALYRFDRAEQISERVKWQDLSPVQRQSVLMSLGENALLARRYDKAEMLFREAEHPAVSGYPLRLAVYLSRLDLCRGHIHSALLRLTDVAGNIADLNAFDVSDYYIMTYLVKAYTLVGENGKALEIARILDETGPVSLRNWPGPVWRRFAGIAAFSEGDIHRAVTYMAIPDGIDKAPPIIAVHHTAPALEFMRLECKTGTDIPTVKSFMDLVKPLSWRLVEAHFRFHIEECIRTINQRNQEMFLSCLDSLIGDIYE